MALNMNRLGREITPPGWKLLSSQPVESGWEFGWNTGCGGEFAFSAIVVTNEIIAGRGRRQLGPYLREQMLEQDRDLRAGGHKTRRTRQMLRDAGIDIGP